MKKALIVGASSGMGRELVQLLAENGYSVGITGRRAALLKEVQSQFPDRISYRAYDCRALDNARELEQLKHEVGGMELLILCAGSGEINKSLDFRLEKETNDLNVQAFTEIVCWAFNSFIAQGDGQIAVITSIAGIRGGRVAPAYNASKAYQIHYLEGLRQRAARMKLPISITDIRPGFVDTAMAKGDRKFWVVPKEKAARQAFYHIRKKSKIAYISKRWRLIAWLFKLMPLQLYQKL